MNELTFDLLPNAVGFLIEKVSNLEQLLSSNQNSGNNSDKPLTTEEAASFLNLEVVTLYALVHKRNVPFHKRGKKLYFFKKELVEWIRSGGESAEGNLTKKVEETFLAANKKEGGKR